MIGLPFFGRRQMKKTIILIALASMTGLTACATAKGVVSDTYGAGKFVVRQISNDD